MSMMEKFKNFIGVPEDEYEEEEEEMEFTTKFKPLRPVNDNMPQERDETPSRSNKVVNIAATTQLQVILVKPERFEDASFIADHLNEKRTVVLNLESTNKDVSRRLIDFLSGVAYANEGQIKRVANLTYLITPYNVDFVGDLLDELENSGVYF